MFQCSSTTLTFSLFKTLRQPHGDAPTVIRSPRSIGVDVVMGDTSYSDVSADDNRGKAVSEVGLYPCAARAACVCVVACLSRRCACVYTILCGGASNSLGLSVKQTMGSHLPSRPPQVLIRDWGGGVSEARCHGVGADGADLDYTVGTTAANDSLIGRETRRGWWVTSRLADGSAYVVVLCGDAVGSLFGSRPDDFLLWIVRCLFDA